MDYKETFFYQKYKPLVDEFVKNGGNVDDLRKKDTLYARINDYKLLDENGNRVDLDTKFKILEHPRNGVRVKDSEQAFIEAVEAFRATGQSFHQPRKQLPFYSQLHTYARHLKYKGFNLEHEEIMKMHGYREYSDIYFRCMGLDRLKDYRDSQGYVDSYKKNEKMKNYIESLADTYNIPYYLIIGLVCEEKQKRVVLQGDFIGKLKRDLINYIDVFHTLKGLKTKDYELYNRIIIAKRLLSDGSGAVLTSKDVLTVLGIENVESNFNDTTVQDLDIEEIMQDIKANYDGTMVKLNTIKNSDYRKICKKAISMGIFVSDLFKMYGMKCNGLKIERLSRIYLNEIPYINEMIERKHELIKESGISIANGNCKEEIMEITLKASLQAYEEFKGLIADFADNGDLQIN